MARARNCQVATPPSIPALWDDALPKLARGVRDRNPNFKAMPRSDTFSKETGRDHIASLASNQAAGWEERSPNPSYAGVLSWVVRRVV
jgi:hypothetical protein